MDLYSKSSIILSVITSGKRYTLLHVFCFAFSFFLKKKKSNQNKITESLNPTDFKWCVLMFSFVLCKEVHKVLHGHWRHALLSICTLQLEIPSVLFGPFLLLSTCRGQCKCKWNEKIWDDADLIRYLYPSEVYSTYSICSQYKRTNRFHDFEASRQQSHIKQVIFPNT